MFSKTSRTICGLGGLMICFLWLAGGAATVLAQRGANPQGPYIVSEGRPAPWVNQAMAETLDDSMLLGNPVEFWASEVSSPSVLGCRDARYERKQLQAEGLFQGHLPPPAESSAASLGFSTFPVPTVRVTCSTGVYDYHQLSADKLLIAVDNVIWTVVPARSNP
ncbi:MAG: hypothetical protein AB9873_18155 [Syntrophobacteraceae bacterium]